jgi:hypothetical protein
MCTILKPESSMNVRVFYKVFFQLWETAIRMNVKQVVFPYTQIVHRCDVALNL